METVSSISSEEHMLYAIGYCVFILLLALISRKFPPKKINWAYGYRTSRSMSNETIWRDANNYASKMMLKMSLYSFTVPILVYFIYPDYNFIVTIIVNTALILSIFFFTERYLDLKYDAKGNPKSSEF